ncbi:MAG: sigma-70 family RNA polymerase sigma factor [Oscillospiraceae bacterium]|nr:sigma-70 family RNA polymerase sigma factor [Oscillospiraceae bacterium]
MTDAEIIDLFWNREQDAITQTSKQYGNYCFAIANGILDNREDSEECVSDTWHRAWGAMPPQRPNKLSLFLGKITRHLAFDKYKMRKAQKRGGSEFSLVLDELDECIPSPNTTPQAIIEAEELERIINQFLHGLPERDCSIFLLRYWHNKPLAEIASRLGAKENNVKASLFRTRQKLKAHLEKEGVTL